jgi:hypothetical protein
LQVDSAAPQGQRGTFSQCGLEQKMFWDSTASRLKTPRWAARKR